MKIYLILLPVLLLAASLSAQKLQPTDLSPLIRTQGGKPELMNLIFVYGKAGDHQRFERISSLKDSSFLEYARDKYNILFADAETDREILSGFESTSYPFIVLTDAQGREINRCASVSSRDYIKLIGDLTAAGLTFPEREEKFRKDPAYGAKYAYYLGRVCKMPAAAEKIVLRMLDRKIQKRFFIKKGRNIMTELVADTGSPVIASLENHRKAIRRCIGRKAWNRLTSDLVFSMTDKAKTAYNRDKDPEAFRKVVAGINRDKNLSCAYSRFLEEHLDALLSRDPFAIGRLYSENYWKMDAVSRECLLKSLNKFIYSREQAENAGAFKEFFNRIISREKDSELAGLAKKNLSYLEKFMNR